jgi:hypothetical protein
MISRPIARTPRQVAEKINQPRHFSLTSFVAAIDGQKRSHLSRRDTTYRNYHQSQTALEVTSSDLQTIYINDERQQG